MGNVCRRSAAEAAAEASAASVPRPASFSAKPSGYNENNSVDRAHLQGRLLAGRNRPAKEPERPDFLGGANNAASTSKVATPAVAKPAASANGYAAGKEVTQPPPLAAEAGDDADGPGISSPTGNSEVSAADLDAEGDGAPSNVPSEPLPFFLRARISKEQENECLQVRAFEVDEASAATTDPSFSLPSPKTAAWSPNGSSFAVVDPARGVVVVELSAAGEAVQRQLAGSSEVVQDLQWSPLGTYLVTQYKLKADDPEPNVHVWKSQNDNYTCVTAFQSNRERGQKVIQWSHDERFCCKLLPDGAIELLNGAELTAEPLTMLSLAHPAQSFNLAPARSLTLARIAVFMADSRDAMMRVIAPGELAIFDMAAGGKAANKTATVSVDFGQQADLEWSPTGTAVLAHCQTEVDDSGQSYYGGSKLLLVSHDGRYTLDLTEAKDKKGTAVQGVSWSPTRDEFVLIQGFQPATVTCWVWDPTTRICSKVAVLQEKVHRNTIRWNHFGSIVCIAGFGNLAGDVEFFGRTRDKQCKLVRVSSCEANCTVSAEWAPNGRHFMTAVLAPRMRVDNGIGIWCALTGKKIANMPFEELLQVQWKPEALDSVKFPDVGFDEIDRASKKAAASGTKKQAYRPKGAGSGGGDMVARMMRGEVAPLEDQLTDLLEQLGQNKRAEQVAVGASPLDEPRKQPQERQPQERYQASGAPVKDMFQKQEKQENATQVYGQKKVCPPTGWQYKDPSGTVQGPFTLEQMQKWYPLGLFKQDLLMRCDPNDRFMKFKEMFPHPMIPFHSYPKRPTM